MAALAVSPPCLLVGRLPPRIALLAMHQISNRVTYHACDQGYGKRATTNLSDRAAPLPVIALALIIRLIPHL
jgi:hypothetical protein